MKNLKRNICWTFKDLLLFVPSLISQIRSSGSSFLFSFTSKISIIGFIYSNERRITSVLVKLKLKLHKSSILAPFFSDGSNANVSGEEPECHNYLLRIVLASGTLKMGGPDSIFRAGRVDTTDVFIFVSQCSTRLTHQTKSGGTGLNMLF